MEIQSLDLRTERCPMALLLAKRTCATLAKDEQIDIVVTDSGALRDIPRYLVNKGFRVTQRTVQDATVLTITKL
ncbi:sulfurtransferase TusA family protein [Enterovibrio norvegicus]|uniref:sulfurtransferase TusA family protein n=1 Tax=Enterovibrio norvegicus TaxID=188144 RepID=UPI000C830BF3|nr:sulfurtransferase TusA family protein [Enterovibrio norvegicus]PMI29341.1 sirA-like family protein [Enterovibrio norvegicus]TKF34811.1 sulfurtransferase TusA family protein [Enterovibrio norvegicus]